MNNVAKNLRALLNAKGLTQTEFAKKMGTRQATVANWINGTNGMPLGMIIRVCKEYDLSLDDFILGEMKIETRFSA
jgi:transcriptional regulator with XRE-family HTH domain